MKARLNAGSPKLKKGFDNARKDLEPDKTFIVYSGTERYFLSEQVEVISLRGISEELLYL